VSDALFYFAPTGCYGIAWWLALARRTAGDGSSGASSTGTASVGAGTTGRAATGIDSTGIDSTSLGSTGIGSTGRPSTGRPPIDAAAAGRAAPAGDTTASPGIDTAATGRPGNGAAQAHGGRIAGAGRAAWEAIPKSTADGRRLSARLVLIAALALHAAALLLPWSDGVFHFGFGKLLSATLWVGVTTWLIESTAVPLGRLELVLLPAAVVAMWLPWFYPGAAFRWDDGRPLFVPHLFFGTLAYAVMFLAAMHALLMAALERRLKPRHGEPLGWLDRLLTGGDAATPPLMVLERTLFRFIGTGFLLLLATTVTGLVFSEETFGRPLLIEHKTVFSLIATAFFGFLLTGRRLRGWRGRRALKLATWGFALLLLSYVGSRFVLEVVLKRV
jgi:ABC-type uncharacterized transport system permease subunit